MRRVVVTGTGVVSCFGCDVPSFWQAIKRGQSGVRTFCDAEAGVLAPIGAPVTGFSPHTLIDAKSLRLMAPSITFGVGAAELAVRDSGLAVDQLDPSRFGGFIGSRGHSSQRQDFLPAVHAAITDGVFHLHRFGTEGLPRVPPLWLLRGLANNVLYFVSLRHNIQGMNNNLSLGGMAATVAIGEAFEAIRRGYVDVALAGGYDSALDLDRVEMYGASGFVTPATDPEGASRPFDRQRAGFVPAEGAGMLILETLDSARARGAKVYGEVLGFGSASAWHSDGRLTPSSAGFASAVTGALDHARVRPDAVFTHGFATVESDAEETKGLKAALGPQASDVPAPAIKSMVGNSFAASGGIEAIAALMALEDGFLPPTINLTDPDPACDLDYVAVAGRPAPLRAVILTNANFGGGHAALVFARLT